MIHVSSSYLALLEVAEFAAAVQEQRFVQFLIMFCGGDAAFAPRPFFVSSVHEVDPSGSGTR